MTDILSFFSWYVAILCVGWIAFPISYHFLSKLRSKGFALSKPLGLLLWGYLFWILGSLGILQNNLGGVSFAILILASISLFFCRKGKLLEIRQWITSNLKLILSMEILFFLLFAGWTIFKAANPEVAYTEKPMEMAFINSILRSDSLPPKDPWLSGYAISYYYFGYVIISLLIRVTGIASSVSFNLSAALWFALTALAAYGLVFDLLIARQNNEVEGQDNSEKSLPQAWFGGFLGPLFILFTSCMEGVLEYLYAAGIFWKPDVNGTLSSRFWSWLNITDLNVPPATPFNWTGTRLISWQWWRGSRVIQDISLSGNKIEVIGEFPFFSYLLSDLHPHVLAMPFGLLAVGICLNLFLDQSNDFIRNGFSFSWLKRSEFWFVAVICGSFGFLNTWDFPIYVGLFCLVLVYSRICKSGWSSKYIGEFLYSGLLIGISGIVLYLPFYIGFQNQAGGFLPSMEYMTRGVHFWILFAVLLFPILGWLFVQIFQPENPKKILNGIKFSAILFLGLFFLSTLTGVFILSLTQIGNSGVGSENIIIANISNKLQMAGQAFSGLHESTESALLIKESIRRRLTTPGTWVTLFLMVSLTWALLSGKASKSKVDSLSADPQIEVKPVEKSLPTQYFVYFLILIGLALTTFPEYFYLRDDFGSRMNTIFKFYFLAWLLWGIAAAYASADLFSKLRGWKSWLFNIFWVLIITGSLAYPVIMVFNKTNHFKPDTWTLDGNAYIKEYSPDDYSAIEWLTNQTPGVVAEAIGGSYSEFARISTRTGFPTVLGWIGHEGQWRGGYTEVGSRESEIKTLYETDSWAEAQYIIEKYNIKYIYIGSLENSNYRTVEGKFDSILQLVYQNSTVSIYEVPNTLGE